MIVMEPVPRSGTFRAMAAALESARLGVIDGQQSRAPGAAGRRDRYLQAVQQAHTHLRPFLNQAQMDLLLRPTVYFTVLSAQTSDDQTVGAINGEYERLSQLLEQQRVAAVHQDQYWSRAGALVLPDTNYWINEWRRYATVDYEKLFEQHEEPVMTVIVPMVVVDELDTVSHKTGTPGAFRAKLATRFIQKHAGGPGDAPATIPAHNLETGSMTVQIAVVDHPPQHHRAPINDDEIVEIAAHLSEATGNQVLLISADTAGFPLRARLAGQKVLDAAIPPNPDAPSHKGKQRR